MSDQRAVASVPSFDTIVNDWSSHSDVDPLLLIDGAGMPSKWLSELAAMPIRIESLYGGDLASDVGSDGPFVAQFSAISSTEWDWCQTVLTRSSGVLLGVNGSNLLSVVDFQECRRHLRKFNAIKLPDLRPVMFRYYDPRVLLVMKRQMNPESWRSFADPFASIIVFADGSLLQLATLD